MRILVYPHDLIIGGSPINAIDTAAQVASAGHEVLVYGIRGPLAAYIEKLGLRYIAANRSQYRPSLSRIRELLAIAKREKIDLIHTYEWSTCLDAFYGAALLQKIPLLCTVLSMQVQPFVPPSVPLIMGTQKLGADARQRQDAKVWVVEPPIDTKNDSPAFDGTGFRQMLGVSDDTPLIALVSRLAIDLKLDALVQAIDAAEILSLLYPVKLVIVGDGPARAALEARAARVNKGRHREVIRFMGAMLDPRPAYAAADIVVGMGSSSMRAMAMGKPVVVQGERGFCRTFSPQSEDYFLHEGFYGIGDGSSGANQLAEQINSLIANADERATLGQYGRKTIVDKFSLAQAGNLHLDIYRQILENRPNYPAADAVRSAYLAFMQEVRNHDPRRKRERQFREFSLLEATRSMPPSPTPE